jgi:hypothetical protein
MDNKELSDTSKKFDTNNKMLSNASLGGQT